MHLAGRAGFARRK
ncbi:MAG: hypothetical protein HRU27_19590 [Rhizobiaceae bacterium]|nr:hypothetical protein [Rhizobiaceae bacterium]